MDPSRRHRCCCCGAQGGGGSCGAGAGAGGGVGSQRPRPRQWSRQRPRCCPGCCRDGRRGWASRVRGEEAVIGQAGQWRRALQAPPVLLEGEAVPEGHEKPPRGDDSGAREEGREQGRTAAAAQKYARQRAQARTGWRRRLLRWQTEVCGSLLRSGAWRCHHGRVTAEREKKGGLSACSRQCRVR